jgi:hypothetical protein
MCGAIPPLPNTPSWCGAQFKKSTGTTLPLPLHISDTRVSSGNISEDTLQQVQTQKRGIFWKVYFNKFKGGKKTRNIFEIRFNKSKGTNKKHFGRYIPTGSTAKARYIFEYIFQEAQRQK